MLLRGVARVLQRVQSSSVTAALLLWHQRDGSVPHLALPCRSSMCSLRPYCCHCTGPLLKSLLKMGVGRHWVHIESSTDMSTCQGNHFIKGEWGIFIPFLRQQKDRSGAVRMNTAPFKYGNHKIHPDNSAVGTIWNSGYTPPCLSPAVCAVIHIIYFLTPAHGSLQDAKCGSVNDLLDAALGVLIREGLGAQSGAFNHT